ncbi:MAG: hypothetical protein K6E19_06095 [Lachnospiraceae bacterium]|nr:hypothetical protein [Lachnospiraceae bacterium]
MRETLSKPQQNSKEQKSSHNYMNEQDSAGSPSKDLYEAPAIRQSASYGSDQGGLIDWFKSLFGYGKQKKQEEVDNSGWQEKENEREYLAMVPNSQTGAPLYELEKDSTIGGEEKMQPVFETHSITPRESIDQLSAMHLHSFIGLRYTKFDEDKGKLRRKRVKIGYGGNGSARGPAGFMDDNDTQADISTETPIPMRKFENVVAAIDQVQSNIEKEEAGQDSGKGFSGKYNVLLNNCNHFVEAMAKTAGANVPASLHHSILGPAGAYRQLANGAENGQQGGTRFFQGGSMSYGQMSRANRKAFLQNYRTEAERALSLDSIKPSDDPRFEQLINNLVTGATALSQYVGDNALQTPDSAEGKTALLNLFDKITRDVRAVVEFNYSTPHPRINISALKVEALVNWVRKERFRTKRDVKDLTERELAYRLENSSDAEMRAGAGRDKNLTNEKLFSEANLKSNTYGTAAAEIFVQAAGISDIDEFVDQTGRGLRDTLGSTALLRGIREKISESGEAMFPYLRQYLNARRGVTPRQHAKLITFNILKLFNKLNLSNAYSAQAMASDKDTGQLFSGPDLTEEQMGLLTFATKEKAAFLNPNKLKPEQLARNQRSINERTDQLLATTEVENAVYDKIMQVLEEENGSE